MILTSVIIIIAVALDQITKYLAVEFLKPIGTFPIIKDVFHLTYTTNEGAIGGIFSGQTIFFIIMAVVLSIVFIYAVIKFKPCLFDKIGIALIIAGGLGNVIDRLFRMGSVVDFFDFRLINFYIFNVADICVTVGIIMLIISTLFLKKSLYNKIEEYFKNKKSDKQQETSIESHDNKENIDLQQDIISNNKEDDNV